MNPLDKVYDWNVDAANDPDMRFFVPQGFQDRVIDGRRCLVIGRRGTGKTALANFIHSKNTPFSTILNFDSGAFGSVQQSDFSKIGFRQDLISIWVYLIYMSVMENMYKQRVVLDYDTRARYADAFDHHSRLTFGEKSAKWFERDYTLTVPGIASLSTQPRQPGILPADPRKRRLAVEADLRACDPGRPIYVIFDNSDDGIHVIPNGRIVHLELVTSLIKAAFEIKKSEFGRFVRPLVLLREDLFHILDEDDKSKWRDLSQDLKWNEASIEAVVSRRISSSLEIPEGDIGRVWPEIYYSGERTRDGSGNLLGMKTIREYSQNRPRDYIAFLKEAAQTGLKSRRNRLSQPLLDEAIPEYSRYAFLEARSEMRMLSENGDLALKSLQEVNKQRFPTPLLRDRIEINLTKNNKKDDSEILLKALIQCGVLGNKMPNALRFVYQDPFAPLNVSNSLELHKSLYHALGIL